MFRYKLILILTLATLALTSARCLKCSLCTKALEEEQEIEKAERAVNLSLRKLAGGPEPIYKLVGINEASSKESNGTLYQINADLIDKQNIEKTCDIRIHSQPWINNGVEITFDCPGEEKVTRNHNF